MLRQRLGAICGIALVLAGCVTPAAGFTDEPKDEAADANAEAATPPTTTEPTGPDPDAAIVEETGSHHAVGTDDAAVQAPITFTLVDAAVITVASGEAIAGFDPIAPGARIDLGRVGTSLTILAMVHGGTTGSVQLTLDGTVVHVEEAAPYSLCGDDGAGTFTACALGVGPHTLVAVAYGGAGLDGGASAAGSLVFTIVNGADGGH